MTPGIGPDGQRVDSAGIAWGEGSAGLSRTFSGRTEVRAMEEPARVGLTPAPPRVGSEFAPPASFGSRSTRTQATAG